MMLVGNRTDDKSDHIIDKCLVTRSRVPGTADLKLILHVQTILRMSHCVMSSRSAILALQKQSRGGPVAICIVPVCRRYWYKTREHSWIALGASKTLLCIDYGSSATKTLLRIDHGSSAILASMFT